MASKSTPTESSVADLIANECLAVRVRLLNRTITSIFDDALRPLGLTAGQLNLLAVIAKKGPIASGEIAAVLNMEKSTVSRNLDRMHKSEWLKTTDAVSGSKQLLELSAKGRRLLQRAVPAWTDAQQKTKALLGQSGAHSIHRVGNAVWSQLGRT